MVCKNTSGRSRILDNKTADNFCVGHRWCGFDMAKATALAHSCPMKIAEAVRKSATKRGLAEEEALKRGWKKSLKSL
jgi:hypothetical protein